LWIFEDVIKIIDYFYDIINRCILFIITILTSKLVHIAISAIFADFTSWSMIIWIFHRNIFTQKIQMK